MTASTTPGPLGARPRLAMAAIVTAVGLLALAAVLAVRLLTGSTLPTPLGYPELDLGVPVVAWSETGTRDLHLHLFTPAEVDRAADTRLPAVLFLHGARGNPGQYVPLAEAVAAAGMIGIPVEYRTFAEGSTTATQAVQGRQLLRWVRDHADELHVDPDRVVVTGASAGGRLALATLDRATTDGTRGDPDALVLLNPAANAGALIEGTPRPPAIVLHAEDDQQVPVATAEALCAAYGPTCAFTAYPDGGHGFFQTAAHREATANQLVAFVTATFGRD